MTYQANAVGSTPGIEGDSTINTANGVKATSSAGASAMYATIYGPGAAVHGYAYGSSTGYNSWAVYGRNDNPNAYGVYGYGVGAGTRGVYGVGEYSGVQGYGYYGVIANASSSGTAGIWAIDNGLGAYAGLFSGNVQISGNMSAATKSFLIDHPLDPAARYLEHACVESPEMKNIYDGSGLANDAGLLEVQLPAYFEALNRDIRYLLTSIGAPSPNLHIRDELHGGRFVIAGAAPGQKICWLVTGTRNDAFAKAHPIVVERDKSDAEKGLFLHPEEHGQPADRGIHYERRRALEETRTRTGSPAEPPVSSP